MTLERFHNEIKERIKILRVTTGNERYLDVFCNISLACRSKDYDFVSNRIKRIKKSNMEVWRSKSITDAVEYKKYCDPLLEIESLFREVDEGVKEIKC